MVQALTKDVVDGTSGVLVDAREQDRQLRSRSSGQPGSRPHGRHDAPGATEGSRRGGSHSLFVPGHGPGPL